MLMLDVFVCRPIFILHVYYWKFQYVINRLIEQSNQLFIPSLIVTLLSIIFRFVVVDDIITVVIM